MEKQKIISLGNGCDSKLFFNLLGMDEKSPLDNSWFKRGPELFKYVFNGEFFKAIENRDISPSDPSISEENAKLIEVAAGARANTQPIVHVHGEEFQFPHVTYFNFLKHIDERCAFLKSAFENPNSMYTITNGTNSKFTTEAYCKDILNWAPFLENNLIIVAHNLPPQENEWRNLGVPCIEVADWAFFEKREERTYYCFAAWKRFESLHKEIAERLVEPTLHFVV